MKVEITKFGEATPRSQPLLIIDSDAFSSENLQRWTESIPEEFSFYSVSTPLPSSKEVYAYSLAVEQECARLGLKRITLCAKRSGSGVAFCFAANSSRLIRRLIVLDGVSREFQSPYENFIDVIERRLPLGLPLRRLGKEYDARSTLHRIHCPSLLLSSPGTDAFAREQFTELRRRIPNAWGTSLREQPLDKVGNLSQELIAIFSEFLKVPVKCPQKGKSQKAANQ